MNTQPIELFKSKRPVIVSGPCSAETEEQTLETCRRVAATGKVDILRAGIWKPRTRPNSFEGVGTEGLKWMKKAKEETGLLTSVEVANFNHVFEALKAEIDILWIGARTTVNPFSVQEIANALEGTNAIVFVKNPINPDIELWTGALERLNKAGITKLGMIHRGFAQHGSSIYRNEPRWQLAVEMKLRFPGIPMLCDPSHIAGNRELIRPISQQALDMNYEGLMIESHIDPDNAWSDKKQQVTPDALGDMLDHFTIRRPSVPDAELNEKLNRLRRQIDMVDDELIELLGKRMKIAEDIGEVKKEKGVTILQTNRWEEIIEKTSAKGNMQGLSERFMIRYLNAIHQESIDHQNEVMNQADMEQK
ncbi:MAG: bifunctional 3-deoxy-7-phosphoheptulonate synthase/chorismate mutase type II [Ekhidna sp.]|nr:bifunctional 3-deoxy-7-phosphoheptulonate synthase/chorismate mutase type II [Ekhidna sp.]MBC6425709.1 bifunctional 3-deoxy-7-phosphoheptulonate synthase/chorismate mutase type II [Ekhidna sp.]